MRLARIELSPVEWRMRGALAEIRPALAVRSGVRVRLSDTDGCRGLGEALPLPSAGTEPLEPCREALEYASRRLEGASGELGELLATAAELCISSPAALCALDTALHDLEGRRRGLPVARLLAETPLHELPVNALLQGLEPAELEAARLRGYRTVKLKLGRATLVRELRRVEELARTSALRLRLDPNGAWTRNQANLALGVLEPLGIELVEQPLAAGDLEGMRALARGPIPIAADESLARADARAALVAGELTPLAVLKPMVLGGLAAAAQLARAAAGAGVRCLVTTTLDGPIATAAAAQLAAAVCDGSLACGLASADAIDAGFPHWLQPRFGRIALPDHAGLGLEACA